MGSRQKLTHADVVLAAVAPDVIGHLKPTQTENSSFVLVHVGSHGDPGSPCLRLWLQLRCKGRGCGSIKNGGLGVPWWPGG